MRSWPVVGHSAGAIRLLARILTGEVPDDPRWVCGDPEQVGPQDGLAEGNVPGCGRAQAARLQRRLAGQDGWDPGLAPHGFKEGQQGLPGSSLHECFSLAEHFHWILSQAAPGSKAIIWAHNNHVSKALRQDWMGIQPMGRYLRTVLGEDYLVIGTAFLRGKFLAQAEERATHDVQTFELPPEPKGTLDAALASTGYPLLALDLRQIPTQGQSSDWFRTPQGTWTIGAKFNPADRDVNTQMIVPADCYDVLVFVKRTNPPRHREE